jgi:hypothetical protein
MHDDDDRETRAMEKIGKVYERNGRRWWVCGAGGTMDEVLLLIQEVGTDNERLEVLDSEFELLYREVT